MTFVSDRRLALVFALAAATQLALGLSLRADPPLPNAWLLPVSVGALMTLLLADGVQRALRGDPRALATGPDGRSIAAAIVGFVGLAVVGAWSFALGHHATIWAILAGGGLVGAAICGWVYYVLSA